MENASKALIIAGAILISILIIGLSVYIYNNASSTIKKANLNSQEAQAQNQQFEAYFGDRKSAAEVKQLMSLIRSNNITGSTAGEEKGITVVYNGSNSTPQEVSANVKAGTVYWVGVENDLSKDTGDKKASYYESGFIKRIYVGTKEPGTATGE